MWLVSFFRISAKMCAKYKKNIGTKGSYMLFDACESRILIHSASLPRSGIAGNVGFSNFISC